MADADDRLESIQILIAFLREHLVTVQDVAARTESILDQEVLEDVCRDVARLLDRMLALTTNQRRQG